MWIGTHSCCSNSCGRVELAARERLAGKRERQERDGEERASHSGGFPKYETSESTSSTV